jgi:hypothetical protein
MTQTSAHAQVPSELVGTWHYNWVSWVHQQNPTTGHWLPPTAVDITFVFTQDGQFELRDFRQTSSWCTLTTYETASGQFRADQVNVTLYPSQGAHHLPERLPRRLELRARRRQPTRHDWVALGSGRARRPGVGAGVATGGGERLRAGAGWGRGGAARRPARQPRPSLRLSHAARIDLAVPGRPIGPWSRRTGTPLASATRRDHKPAMAIAADGIISTTRPTSRAARGRGRRCGRARPRRPRGARRG